MMAREFTPAERTAEMVMDAHGEQISAAVYTHGQKAIVGTLHALANLIERSEFTFKVDWIH